MRFEFTFDENTGADTPRWGHYFFGFDFASLADFLVGHMRRATIAYISSFSSTFLLGGGLPNNKPQLQNPGSVIVYFNKMF